MDFVTLLFYIFSLFVVGSAVAVVASRNPVHSVLWLIFAFFNAAGLFILLGAEMLALLLVIVYVGAVAVLFLFVVMMLNIKTSSFKKGVQAYLPLGLLLLAAVLFGEITMVINNSTEKINISKEKAVTEEIYKIEPSVEAKSVEANNVAAANSVIADNKKQPQKNKQAKVKITKEKSEKTETKKLEKEKTTEEKPAEAEKTVIETSAVTHENTETLSKATNAQAIGRILYTEYVLYFQLSGLILLVAMIGAIVLTLRHRTDVRRQKTSAQHSRSNTIQMMKVESGKGIN